MVSVMVPSPEKTSVSRQGGDSTVRVQKKTTLSPDHSISQANSGPGPGSSVSPPQTSNSHRNWVQDMGSTVISQDGSDPKIYPVAF